MTRASVQRAGWFRWYAVVTIYAIDFRQKPPKCTEDVQLQALEGPFWSRRKAERVAAELAAHQAAYEFTIGVVP
jgi:hypothetical protein